MALNSEQAERLGDMLSDIQGNMSQLSKWEREFIGDQLKRFDTYGADMFLSPKQWNVIKNVHEKVSGIPPDDGAPPPEPDDYDEEIPF